MKWMGKHRLTTPPAQHVLLSGYQKRFTLLAGKETAQLGLTFLQQVQTEVSLTD
jgi:hypothetical protein